MHRTHKDEILFAALMDLVGFLNSPQRDDLLLKEAGVSLDRALFPLLVRVGALGPLAIAELAAQVGRDHSTISRQIAKLEALGLVTRPESGEDQRVRPAAITRKGEKMVEAISAARQRVYDHLFREWSREDRENVGRLVRKLADSMLKAAEDAGRKR